MKRMFSKKQIEEIIKANSTRLYEHNIEGEYTNDNGDSCVFSLKVITPSPNPLTDSLPFDVVSIKGQMTNTDDDDTIYNVFHYDGANGVLLYQIQGTASFQEDTYDDWVITTDNVVPL